ncbi:hypothetical protein C489_05218 [Natrinema versiforme JCM 10478]|uniref:Uncharacterized protein n=1 Tax=Natrinema versiforme JCM 10478 TaxID=1227496 RepID=L9Y6H0_9EURY|nr:hypothetical protein C489_05218 [Natrinema versiforme JCM 10478]
MVNKQDDEHAAFSELEDAYGRLYTAKDNGSEPATPDGGTGPGGNGSQSGSPSSGGAPEFPESDDGPNDPVPSASEPECPNCGSKDNESSDVYLDRNRDRLEDDHVRMLRKGDYVCLGCGGVFSDE